MVLDATLLNTLHYKVQIKGKVEQSWEWSSALSYTPAIEKRDFESPLTKVANFYFYIYIYIYIYIQWKMSWKYFNLRP